LPAQAARLTAYWGDEFWREDVYHPEPQRRLFGQPEEMEKAGFPNVPKPLAMRIPQGPVVYYLFFASQKPVANDIVESIFARYADRRG